MGTEEVRVRFEEFVAARGHALLQLATLLSREPATAPALLDAALADVVTHWRRAEREGPEDAVRRRLVQVTLRRRRRTGRRTAGSQAPGAVGQAPAEVPGRRSGGLPTAGATERVAAEVPHRRERARIGVRLGSGENTEGGRADGVLRAGVSHPIDDGPGRGVGVPRAGRSHPDDDRASHPDDDGPARAGAVETEVRGFLHGLPPRARAVLVLRHWLDLDDAEAAALLDTSPASVRATADKHLPRLRAALPDHDVDAEIRHVLLTDADAVPQPTPQLPDAVTRLARRHRRRRLTASAAAAIAVAATGAVAVPWVLDVAKGPEPDVDASLAEPMRLRDCPGGRLHSATDPRLPPSMPPPRTVAELLEQGWIVTARPRYPDARPHLAARTTSTRDYVFLTPDRRRVGVVRLAFVDDGWRFTHLEYC